MRSSGSFSSFGETARLRLSGAEFFDIAGGNVLASVYDQNTDTFFVGGQFTGIYVDSLPTAGLAILSEDYTFCRRWQKLGGQIWFDPKVVLGHVGSYKFTGHNLRTYL